MTRAPFDSPDVGIRRSHGLLPRLLLRGAVLLAVDAVVGCRADRGDEQSPRDEAWPCGWTDVAIHP